MRTLLGLAVLIGIFAMIWSGIQQQQGTSAEAAGDGGYAEVAGGSTSSPTIVPPRLSDKVAVNKMSWTKGGFGAVALVSLTLKNNNEVAVQDIGVTCHFTGESGTEINSSDKTLYVSIAPGKARTEKTVNFGFIDPQAASAWCEVTSTG